MSAGDKPRLAIIGWPVSHSRSPLIHNYWLAGHAIEAVYEPYPVAPDEDFCAALDAMAAQGFIGANVTIPHKEAAFAAMDELSAAAESLGAVNTISFAGGRFSGDNTDGDGFLAGLEAAAPRHDWRDRPALILGAGGAARAIVAALARAGVGDIRLTNRTRAKAEALASLSEGVSVGDWEARGDLLEGCGLLANTTSLGMDGAPPLDMPLDALGLGLGLGLGSGLDLGGLSSESGPGKNPAAAIVSDIVYTPLETPLLRAARAAGHIGVDGLGMLLNQAALAFEIWFGARPTIDAALRDKLIASLNEEA